MLPPITNRKQVCFITGGSLGLGAALAHELAKTCDVYTCARTDCILPPGISGVQLNIADHDRFVSWLSYVLDKHGAIDYLINNAALYYRGDFVAMTAAEYLEQINTNFTAAVTAMHTVLPAMQRQGFGRIVNLVSSVVLRSNIAGRSLYAATKAGLIELTRGLAAEVADTNIRINALCPGLMDTRMNVDARTARPPAEAVPDVLRLLAATETCPNGKFWQYTNEINW